MKKLNLKQTNFTGGEVLNRAQLKKVFGGTADSTVCSDWRKADAATCLNCCLTVHNIDYCSGQC